MYLPRSLISKLYLHLLRTRHLLSPSVLILVALEPDALCACRILTALLKRDYIPHKIKPITGYADLSEAGVNLIQPMRTTDGGSGGVVICLGVGGLVDIEATFGLEIDENGGGGLGDVEVWVMDSRRPWNLANVFGGQPARNPSGAASDGTSVRNVTGLEEGRITHSFVPGGGGIIVFDDGDIDDELTTEREAYCALAAMPEVDDVNGSDLSGSEDERSRMPTSGQQGLKRKSCSPKEDSESDSDEENPRRRRRTNSSRSSPSFQSSPSRKHIVSDDSSITSRRRSHHSGSVSPAHGELATDPSPRFLRRRLHRLRNKHQAVLSKYASLGTSYSEPISSIMYSLASELGREDNDLLWHAISGVCSMELYGRTVTGIGLGKRSGESGWDEDRGERVRAVLRDEVRRLNPTDPKEYTREQYSGDIGVGIPTYARSPTDNAIRLSPEPRFLLIRHWSLYDSMLHSPYLSTRLRVWSENGKRRLHKLLAKMGVSLAQCRQTYTHMDMDLKQTLRERLLKYGPVYGLDGLVPQAQAPGDREGWGFVRCWGWKACLSATDVAVIVGAILEVADPIREKPFRESRSQNDSANVASGESQDVDTGEVADAATQEAITSRFWTAYDALGSVQALTAHIQTAQHLHRAILRTGSALIEKHHIRHLRAFRMAVVRDGPDMAMFTHPGALVKLALWLAEAIEEKEGASTKAGKLKNELVVAGLDDVRGVYVVVGLGGGSGLSTERMKDKENQRKEHAKKKKEKQLAREKKRAEKQGEDEGEVETEEESDSDEDSEDDQNPRKLYRRNRFGMAFEEAIEETGARVRVDSFEHCIVEVRKEDLSRFLESLSMKTVSA